MNKLISIVIPVYNEAANLPLLYKELLRHTQRLPYRFEVIFVDDGSRDESARIIHGLADSDPDVRALELARNFGKEAAVSAGLHAARGDATIVMDADLQMPPRLIGDFLAHWEDGADIVVGVFATRNMALIRRVGAAIFYRIMGLIGETRITPHATDYRLLDRQVVDAFKQLTEHNRITRGMIDWLGFKRAYVPFEQEARRHGKPTYSMSKLIALAMNSFTSYSLIPLKLAGYLGILILALSIPGGLFMYAERYILHDPWHLLFTGTDMLAIMTVFLVGVVLACMGLVSLYIASIHAEVINRPLYVVRERSRRAAPLLEPSMVQSAPAEKTVWRQEVAGG
ncbi:MAG TPA: glycosyltransferase family 2 protein [Candidatus Pristimantibacillus sp.]|nr:glycosyltransferase family 2 protein [Candidatus Pristimantibacillus sp.]